MRGTLPDRGRHSATAPGLRGEEKVGFIVSRNAVIRPNPTGPIRPALGHRADRSGWIPIRVVPFGFPTARRTVWSDPKKADTTRPGMDHLSTDVPSGHGLWVKSDSPIIAMVSRETSCSFGPIGVVSTRQSLRRERPTRGRRWAMGFNEGRWRVCRWAVLLVVSSFVSAGGQDLATNTAREPADRLGTAVP